MHVDLYRLVFIYLVVVSKTSTGSYLAIFRGLDRVDQTAKDISDEISNGNDITTNDDATSFLEQIPIIGTVLNMLIVGNDAVKERLDDTLNKLKDISFQQQRMMEVVDDSKHKIDYLTTHVLISNAVTIVSSCSQDRQTFLHDPQSQQAKDRFLRAVCCNDIMNYSRAIADILKEDTFTQDDQELYAFLKGTENTCEGPDIIATYKYIFGLVFDGCQTAIITEEMLYHGTSKKMLSKCRQEIIYILDYYRNIFNRCLNRSCDEVQTIIKKSISDTFSKPLREQRNTLSTFLPWFKFFLAKFSADPEFKMIGVHPPSEMTFYDERKYLVLLWTSYAINWSKCDGAIDSSVSFMLAIFSSEVLEEESIGINVNMSRDANPGIVSSCTTHKTSLSYKLCPATTITITNTSVLLLLDPLSSLLSLLVYFML